MEKELIYRKTILKLFFIIILQGIYTSIGILGLSDMLNLTFGTSIKIDEQLMWYSFLFGLCFFGFSCIRKIKKDDAYGKHF
jgi:hypothetical protein